MIEAKTDNFSLYQNHWEDWKDWKVWGPMSRHSRRLVFRQCRRLRFSTVLDVGCGPGVFLKEFLREFPNSQVTGIDLTDSAVDLARKNLPASEFSVLDVSKEVPKGEYDLVTMIDVAEHIEEDIACFKNVREACRGHLVIATLEGRMRSFEPELGHVRNYTPGELESKLEEAGYDVVEFLHWGWPMYSPFYRNLSGSVGIYKKTTTLWHRVMAKVAYCGLMFNWPGKGDLVIAVARPKPWSAKC